MSETKLDDSFPSAQFLLDGFSKPYRLDRCSNGGGILLYIRDGITSRLLSISNKTESIFAEINFSKKKWLICASYNHHKSNISHHLHHLGKGLDNYIGNYDNILLLGDFSSEFSEPSLNDFCDIYNLKKPTCYKNPGNPSCIDLFLTNRPRTFQCTATVETGISDFHKLVVTVLKTFYKKQRPKITHYRNYKNFENDNFRQDLHKEFLKFDVTNAPLSQFNDNALSVLDKHAPKKVKYIRSNNCHFMAKELRKAIMHRSKLRNKFLKTRNEESRRRFNRQRNFCVSLLRKTIRRFFGKLDHNAVYDNRKFWKTVVPLFSEKAFHKESIILNNNKIISNDEELAEFFNKHFSKIVEKLAVDETLASNIASSHITDPVFNAIKKYENHPSIKKIKLFMSGKDLKFSFNFETKNKILAEIHNLDKKKACQESDIPVKIIKDNIDIFSEFILHNFNNSSFDATFPSELKKADVTPIFKKKDRNNVENYRPVSILPNFSKIYERCLYDQMYKYFNHILSKWQCGFRKGFSTQHYLLVMTEKWRKCLDKGDISGAILTDLSKAFDCILHDLLIAKLAAYGFDYQSLRIMESVINNLEKSTNSLLNWFRKNHMKANVDKCHLLVSSDEVCAAKIEDFTIENSTEEKLLGVKFDSNLSFEGHVTSLCKKASQKLHALARISHYMDLNKRRSLMKAFITSQFSYCPLIWMFHSRNLNNKINGYMNELLD